jgi:hypothetical protein
MLGILRPIGVGLIAIALIFLVLGFAMSNDGFGLLFMVCLVAGIILIVVDVVRRRRGA